MKQLFVATGNRGKLSEIRAILHGVVDELLSPDQFPNLPEVEEDGATFEENAIKKARSAAQATGLPSLADDSGLVVDLLHGRPGVLSARYAGEGASDGANIAKLLQDLSSLPAEPKRAHFVCVMAFCLPDGSCATFHGELHGEIISDPAGSHGFGYDPVFYLPDYGMTLAQLDPEQKNVISHRAAALARLRGNLAALEVPTVDGG
jgi:XTP/dITP diphosphohydrolase